MTERPKLSICIPTYNRAPYLATLLQHLQEPEFALPFAWEVIVSNNASSDDTMEILEKTRATGSLPLRVLDQSKNVGAIPNMRAALWAAKGEYSVYLADDDRLLPAALVEAIAMLDRNPNAAALYAPWKVVDLVDKRDFGTFYKQPEDVTISQADFARLIEHVAGHAIFSEICILRTKTFRQVNPVGNDVSFWAFTMPCEYLAAGDLIYAADPFYVSVTRHFVGDDRKQLGHTEVKTCWDRYRGGLEHMFGLALQFGGLKDPARVMDQINAVLVSRMAVALRLRLIAKDDPIEAYALAARIRGLGGAKALPIPMSDIQRAAAVHFLCAQLPELVNAERIAVIGDLPDATLAYLAKSAKVPIARAVQPCDIAERDIVFDMGATETGIVAAAQNLALHHITEQQLLTKFI